MCSEFKAYHYEIVASVESDKVTLQEQVFFDEHQWKTMEFVNHLGDLQAKPQLSVPRPVLMNNRLVHRQLDLLGDTVQIIKKAVKNPDLVDAHTVYVDELPG